MKLSPEALEKLVHRSLRELPEFSPPAGFEARVLAEIRRRQSLPWWRRSYADWPAAMRAGFLILSLAAGTALVWIVPSARLFGAVALRWQGLMLWTSLGRHGAEAAAAVVRAISPLYLYGALAAAAVGYALVIGLGAIAYKSLHRSVSRTPVS